MIQQLYSIPGVPDGYRVVRWGVPKDGEWICGSNGMVFKPVSSSLDFCCLIVEPDQDDAIRPYKNADEFLDDSNGSLVLLNICTGCIETILYIDDDGIETIKGAVSWEDLMVNYEFASGKGCGRENENQ